MDLFIWLLATAGSALVLTQSTITEPLRRRLDRIARDAAVVSLVHDGSLPRQPATVRWVLGQFRRAASAAAKLVSCPMCSGFWFGLGWSAALGTRGPALVAHAFGGSIVSALAVAVWIALIEAQQALALWRYNNSKDPPPDGVCEERMQLVLRGGAHSNPLDIACPRHGVWARGEKCPDR